jgi:glycosyltransferase involved in cell wall biosynthesis
VLLEAMACRCPVIASDIAPCRELITHDQHGLLAPVGDPAAFAKAITGVLTDPVAAARRGEAAIGRVQQRHDLSRVAGQWVHVYQRLLGS